MRELTTTLVFAVRGDKILLAMKKHGHGEGHWNGAGGKIESGETIEQAMVREANEEIGIRPTAYHKAAVNTYYQLYKGESCRNTAHTYICTEWDGEPVESDEMAPRWFPKNALPFGHMWADDPLWLPRMLAGEKLRGIFRYDNHTGRVTSYEILEVDSFDEY